MGTLVLLLEDIDGGSDDACNFTLAASTTSFDCSNVGANTVTLTVTDASNNSSSCDATVSVEDITAPSALCQDITIQLDANGDASITAVDIDGGSDDACNFTLAVSTTTFDCSNVGPNTVTLTLTDASNNSSSCDATVTVEDVTAPAALCQDITIQLDANGDASITAEDIDGGSDDACNFTLAASTTSFDCSNVGPNTVTLTVTDASNNSSSCDATVTVEDVTAPAALCQDITIQLDANGDASITAEDIDGGSDDACNFTLAASTTTFDCSNVGANTVTLTVTDASNNSSSCDATVTVEDVTAPSALCQDITIQLDANGAASITAEDIDGGSDDACNFSLAASTTSFDCSNVGPNTVTLTVTDASNNSSSCDATVTVEDVTAPAALCQDITIQLDANGDASITAQDIDGGSDDACNFSLAASTTSFDCSNVGPNTVTLTVTDASNNSSSCDATVTVEDVTAPSALCQDITIQLDANGDASITAQDIDGGSDDACNFSLAASTTTFDCSNVGPNTVTLTVTDASNNSSSCDATVTVQDVTAPAALCQDITIQLDANGAASITAEDIDGGSDDACNFSLAASTTTFDCSNVGPNTVTLTVTDASNNSSSCDATVTVQDVTAPAALCQDITIQLDANGAASITAEDIDGGSDDACNFSLAASTTSFDCSNVGPNTVTLTVTDASNNSSSCDATVTVEDVTAPAALCQDITIQLDANGDASITAQDIDGGSDDACNFSLAASTTSFDCSNIGPNTVTLTVTDASNNSSSCDATVTVEDVTAPAAICQDITIQLDANGAASITAEDIDGGSDDACNFSLAASTTSFDCSNVGPNTVTLTVTDASNNSSSCDATVTVEDITAPSALCQDITIQLDANGDASITAQDIDGGSDDACNFTLAASTTSFDCSNVGPNTVTLTVTDASNNSSSCDATVTVEDVTAPAALCQDITIQLDANGDASITAQDIDAGSDDACNFSLAASTTSFDCSNVGPNTVTLTVTDASNNSSSCDATVTVEDITAPAALCQDITIQLDANGDASITAQDIDGGSDDACNFSLAASTTSFDCSNVGPNTVTLTVTDASNNSSSCDATITVEDNIEPIPVCKLGFSITLNSAGQVAIPALLLDNGSFDNCSVDLDFYFDEDLQETIKLFDCQDVGTNTIDLYVVDESGNFSRCVSLIQINDFSAPTAICQDITIQLDANGDAGITAQDIDGGSDDACNFSLAASTTSFDCSNVGPNTVTLTVTDASNNSSSCDATVTVEDVTAPAALCQDITIQLDANGDASITAQDIDGGSDDACNFSLAASTTSFDCSNVGANTVTLTLTDASNNSSSCDATVTVEDITAPSALCQDITIQLDANGDS